MGHPLARETKIISSFNCKIYSKNFHLSVYLSKSKSYSCLTDGSFDSSFALLDNNLFFDSSLNSGDDNDDAKSTTIN